MPLPTAEQQQVLDEMVEDVFGTTMPAANPFALDPEPPFYNQNDMVPSRRDSEVAPAARHHAPVWINPVFPPQKAWTGFVCQVPYEDPHQQPPYRHQSLLPFAPLPQPIQPLMPHHPLPPPAPTPPRRPLPHRPLAHRPYPNRQLVRPVNAPANTPAPAPDAPPAKRFKASKGDKPDAQGFVNEDLRSVKQRFKDLAHAGDFVAAKVTKRYKNKELFRYKKEKVEVMVEGGEEMSEEEMRKKGLLRKCEKNG